MPALTPKSDSLKRRQKGSAMVESALTFLVFMVLLLGILDFGRMVWSYTLISYAAREATRYAMVRGTGTSHTASSDQIKAIVTSQAPGLGLDTSNTAVTFTPDQSPGSTVKVAVTYNFTPLVPYIPSGTVTLKSTSQMMIYQ
jgi:Flp pilus assembly protein TadG